jgi:hypothetical protein
MPVKKTIFLFCFAALLLNLSLPLSASAEYSRRSPIKFQKTSLKNDEKTVHDYVERILKQIVRPASGLLPYPYIIPSAPGQNAPTSRLKGTYLQMYDWDTFFVGLRLSMDKKTYLWKDAILDFLAQTAPDGYTPRTLAPYRFWDYPDQCKPFLAQGAYLASKAMRNFSWITPQIFRKLALTVQYWENYRKGADGLYVWRRSVESGVDNSAADLMTPDNTAAGVDLNCYLVREFKALSLIALKLGMKKNAAKYLRKSARLAELINAEMWSKKDKIYYSINSLTGRQIKIKDWTCFLPLWVGIASKKRAEEMIQRHLLNPKEFWGKYGIPSLAFNNPLYNNAKLGFIPGYHTVSNWQGPVWILPNYLIMLGIEHYGYHQEAVEIARKMVRLVAVDIQKNGSAHENYNSRTGKPLNAPNFGSWDLLTDVMLREAQNNSNPTELK